MASIGKKKFVFVSPRAAQRRAAASFASSGIVSSSSADRRTKAGFTIVELLVVIAIIAVLAAIVLVNVTQYIAKSKRSAVESDMDVIQTHAAAYVTDSSTGYTGFSSTTGYLNPKAAIENITGSGTVAEQESSDGAAFCACAPLPDILNSKNQTYCVDSTGQRIQTGVPCSSECQSSASCYANISGSIINGLVGYWKLDESSGSSATDSSGYGNTGTYTGTLTPSTDVPAVNFSDPYSLSFPGPDGNYVNIGDPANLQSVSTGPFTLSAWIKGTNGLNGFAANVLTKDSQATRGFVMGLDSSGYAYLEVGGVSQIGGSSVVGEVGSVLAGDGKWHLLSLTLSGTTWSLYVDGVFLKSVTVAVPAQSTSAWYIGNRVINDGPFKGTIDDVRIYNRALSAAELASLAAGN